MYQLQSQEVSDYIMSDSRTFRAVMAFADGTIIKNEIIRITIQAQTTAKDIVAGGMISQSVTAEISGLTTDLSGKTFVLYFYAVNLFGDLETELIPFGRYKVISCKQSGEKWTVEAKDGFYKSDSVYKPAISFPATTDDVELEICNKLGILPPRYDCSLLCDNNGRALLTPDGQEIYARDSAPIMLDAPLEECTYREMLGYCAALDGGKYAMLDRQGHLIHKGWTDIDYTISPGRADEPKTDDKDITITQIICKASGEELKVTANTSRAMTFENPYMTQDIMGKIASRYLMKPYRPLSIYHRLGDPRLDLLDVVTVERVNGIVHRVPIMSLKFSFDGGLGSTVEATGTPDAKFGKNIDGPITRQTKKIVAESISATEEKLKASFQEMADYIVGNEGGYVVTKFNADNQPVATYYTDNLDIEQAKEFLLINNHGIAGGTNGIHGPLNTAIDIKGRINAAQILTGILSAIVIQSLNYSETNKTGSKINLEDGTFSFGGGAMTFANKLLKLIVCAIDNCKFKVDSAGNVTANSLKSSSADITGGNINIETSSKEYSAIKLKCNEWAIEVSPLQWVLTNSSTGCKFYCQAGQLGCEKNGTTVCTINSNTGQIWTAAGVSAEDDINTLGTIAAKDCLIETTPNSGIRFSLRDILKNGGLI